MLKWNYIESRTCWKEREGGAGLCLCFNNNIYNHFWSLWLSCVLPFDQELPSEA